MERCLQAISGAICKGLPKASSYHLLYGLRLLSKLTDQAKDARRAIRKWFVQKVCPSTTKRLAQRISYVYSFVQNILSSLYTSIYNLIAQLTVLAMFAMAAFYLPAIVVIVAMGILLLDGISGLGGTLAASGKFSLAAMPFMIGGIRDIWKKNKSVSRDLTNNLPDDTIKQIAEASDNFKRILEALVHPKYPKRGFMKEKIIKRLAEKRRELVKKLAAAVSRKEKTPQEDARKSSCISGLIWELVFSPSEAKT